ncbi:MAG TPA: hypothetical protein VM008_02610 [Phycisphaerae bacterium]|nr:hypothetical protein [Phycisphaerae bacterium]
MHVIRTVTIVALLAGPAAFLRAGVTATPAGPATVTTQPVTSQPALPTVESIQALYDAGNYKETVKSANMLLSNRGAAGTFDRHAALMLMAESQFHLQQNLTARNTLERARKEADAAGSTDDAAQAAALAYLIQKSAGHTFTPLTGKDRAPLDVYDVEARKQAFSELFDDALAVCEQKAKAGKSKTDYLPFVAISREFVYVRALDQLVHGNTSVTDGFAKDASSSAADVIDHELADYEAKAHIIEDSANVWIQGETTTIAVHGGATVNHWSRRRGLTATQVSTLETMKRSCEEMPQHIQLMSEAMANPDAFARPFRFHYWWVYYHERPDLSAAAEDVKEHLEEVLNKDYAH